jgi:hypothetical protein
MHAKGNPAFPRKLFFEDLDEINCDKWFSIYK